MRGQQPESSSSQVRHPPVVHLDARVAFGPAPPTYALPHVGTGERVDVTVNKVVGLVRRFGEALLRVNEEEEEGERVGFGVRDEEGTDDEDDDEDEEEEDGEGGVDERPCASTLGRRAHGQRPDRPRKRRRVSSRVRARPSSSSSARGERADGLRGAGRRRDGEAVRAEFEKELLSELTCEICFALMWQPVTTPCQHVSCSFSSSFWSFVFGFWVFISPFHLHFTSSHFFLTLFIPSFVPLPLS